MTGKAEINDPPRKGVIRMIAGGPVGGDSQRARKAQIQEAYGVMTREMIDVEPANDAPLIQFDQEERRGPSTKSDDSLLRWGSSSSKRHISLPLTLGTTHLRETCLLKFLVVDILSAYNVILGRPTLNAFRAIISTYHMKIKFPVIRGVSEAQADALQARKCYVEAIKRGKKRRTEEPPEIEDSNKRGKDPVPSLKPDKETPVGV
ncbi:hypothetical protein Sango_0669500 [Sesamum angolense]|uniref:Uncharacterized protein n=1 Tax=Sesamum angolense TaxID=2727404 RepID=A0AAE1X7B3_9LAMI|nr:hypothetical protein Sango_0669500 [Sesamum angolense]